MSQQLVREFTILILNGYYNAKSAHSEIFNENRTLDNSLIMGYLALASSFINTAHAVYICKKELSRQEFDEFFTEFRVFTDEVMDNIRSNDSHQWSDITFAKFEETFEAAASLLGVTK